MTNPTACRELKPCPFCGNRAKIEVGSSSDERSGYNFIVTVRCSMCLGRIGVGSKHDKNGWCNESSESASDRAIAAWNTRAPKGEAVACSECGGTGVYPKAAIVPPPPDVTCRKCHGSGRDYSKPCAEAMAYIVVGKYACELEFPKVKERSQKKIAGDLEPGRHPLYTHPRATSAEVEILRALVGKWREEATELRAGGLDSAGTVLMATADELEAALSDRGDS